MTITLSENSKASRMKHKFQNCLGSQEAKHTDLFEKFADLERASVLREINLQEGEVPCICFFLDGDTWSLATTRRILWSVSGVKNEVAIQEISQMGWSAGPSYARERVSAATIDGIVRTKEGLLLNCKTDSPWFFILDRTGTRSEILLEQGAPLCAFWNALRIVADTSY